MDATYKITYSADAMTLNFVRISDEAILFSNPNEDVVRTYAEGFCTAKNATYIIL